MTDMDFTRYSRQTMLPGIGEEGQRRLLSSSVLIVGLGGLGAAVATYLTGAGVGRIGLCDPDRVSLSNLQRQVLYTEAQVGLMKVEEAARRLQSQSSHTRFDLYPDGLTEENGQRITGQYDLVVDCTDNFPVRYLIDDLCSRSGKPWVHGAIGEFRGQVAVMNFHNHRCYTDLYPDRDALCSGPRRVAGVIGAVPGVVGAMEAAEALKILTGCGQPLDGRLFSIDLLTFSTSIIEF